MPLLLARKLPLRLICFAGLKKKRMEIFEPDDLFFELVKNVKDAETLSRLASAIFLTERFFRAISKELLTDLQYAKLLAAGTSVGFSILAVHRIIAIYVVFPYFGYLSGPYVPIDGRPHVVLGAKSTTRSRVFVHTAADKALYFRLLGRSRM